VSRLRLSSTCRCCSARAHNRANHVEADVRRILQRDEIVFSQASYTTSPYRASRHQTLGLQFLAAKTNNHRAAAEVRIAADISECPNWDLGVRRLNRHATTINVLKADHVVDIGVLREQLVADPAHGMLDDARDALHGRRYGEQIACSNGPIGIAVAFKRIAVEGRSKRCVFGRDRQSFQRQWGRHHEALLIDPGACWKRLRRVADDDIITANGGAFSEIDQRHLVALRHALAKCGPRRQLRTCGKAKVVGDDGDVVVRVHADNTRCFWVSDDLVIDVVRHRCSRTDMRAIRRYGATDIFGRPPPIDHF